MRTLKVAQVARLARTVQVARLARTVQVALLFAASLLLGAGCRAQVPPATPHNVLLTWTFPASLGAWGGCTAASPCTFGVYFCADGPTACADTTTSSWHELTTPTTRPSAMQYTDTAHGGTASAQYAVVTFQGAASSGPSNVTVPVAVPATPLAPAVSSGLALNAAPQLSHPVHPAIPSNYNALPRASRVQLVAVLRSR